MEQLRRLLCSGRNTAKFPDPRLILGFLHMEKKKATASCLNA